MGERGAGQSGRKYPWGEAEPDATRANYRGAGPGHATPVGLYPAGATPEGIQDLAGNASRDEYGRLRSRDSLRWFAVAGQEGLNSVSEGIVRNSQCANRWPASRSFFLRGVRFSSLFYALPIERGIQMFDRDSDQRDYMKNRWLEVERYRLQCAEAGPDSPYKRATVAAIRSAMIPLE